MSIAASVLLSPLAILAAGETPTIEHTPVTVAVRGQTLFVRARVTGGKRAIKSVTLHCAPSRDAAPFKIPLKDSGAGVYAGSIGPGLFAGIQELTYYIEATDDRDVSTETPWYTVKLKSLEQLEPSELAPQPQQAVPQAESKQKPKWVVPALIGGSLLAIGGVAVLASSSGGGGSSDSGNTNSTTTYAGTYVGSTTTCFAPSGGNSSCSSTPLTIVVGTDGTVSSSDIYDDTPLQTTLSGDSFVLVTQVNQTNTSGEVQFVGTIIDTRIVGSIQGSATSSTGTGAYSGNFTAVRQ